MLIQNTGDGMYFFGEHRVLHLAILQEFRNISSNSYSECHFTRIFLEYEMCIIVDTEVQKYIGVPLLILTVWECAFCSFENDEIDVTDESLFQS